MFQTVKKFSKLLNHQARPKPDKCYIIQYYRKGSNQEEKAFFFLSFPKCGKPPTHPRGFMRFGNTKGEIRVNKGDFRGDLGGLDLV